MKKTTLKKFAMALGAFAIMAGLVSLGATGSTVSAWASSEERLVFFDDFEQPDGPPLNWELPTLPSGHCYNIVWNVVHPADHPNGAILSHWNPCPEGASIVNDGYLVTLQGAEWRDYRAQVTKYRWFSDDYWLLLRFQDLDNFIAYGRDGCCMIVEVVSGGQMVFRDWVIAPEFHQPETLAASIQGLHIEVYSDGNLMFETDLPQGTPMYGRIGLRTPHADPLFDNVFVYAISPPTPPSVTITQLSPNPAHVSESPTLVAEVSDDTSGVESAEWCPQSESLACVWQPMTLTGQSGDSLRTASATIFGLSPGVYSIKVRGQDVAGNWSDPVQAFLVIYDPDAGFATGHGWIIPGTEPGDFLPGITGEDKANFGFVVKYKKGATTPQGQLEFHYQVGDFNLHSTEMHWMVINDNWAKFQGYATINLHPGQLFHFRVDARDTQLKDGNQQDRFILKVWYDYQDSDIDDPVYRASGDLARGNIIIHTK